MTENKRFLLVMDRTFRDKKSGENFVCVWNSDAVTLCELLNELNDENDVLKQQLETKYIVNKQYETLQKLKEENEQLKFDKQQLHRAMSREEVRYKQFRDKVFDLIDEKIKEADVYFKQSYDSWYQGKFDVLTELKKELQE